MGLPIMFDNNTTGVFAVYNDISKLVEISEKSEEANRMKSSGDEIKIASKGNPAR